jgi:hypothetical protein
MHKSSSRLARSDVDQRPASPGYLPVNRKPVKNVAASVRQRLLDKAQQSGLPSSQLLHYFAFERFLFRLSQSEYANNLVLKGALMFHVWEQAPLPRSTMDINFLGLYVSNDVDSLIRVVQEICDQPVEPDGLTFDPSSVRAIRITAEAGYQSVRMRFHGSLSNARLTMQMDVSFGDVVIPSETQMPYPSILDFPPPQVRAYTRESTIAEKFEAAVRLGVFNTRVRDFFDIWFLASRFDFDGPTLALALEETFFRRNTDLSAEPVPLTADFARSTDQAMQWREFRRRNRLGDTPDSFLDLMAAVIEFLAPVTAAISESRPFRGVWNSQGPWRTSV